MSSCFPHAICELCNHTEEELLELKEEFAKRLGAADVTIQSLKVWGWLGSEEESGDLRGGPLRVVAH